MFMLGMVVQKWPLAGTDFIKKMFHAYWPVRSPKCYQMISAAAGECRACILV